MTHPRTPKPSKKIYHVVIILALFFFNGLAQAFDHSHSSWDILLKRHVLLINQGYSSQVNYAGMQSDRATLQSYLDRLSAIRPEEYQRWTDAQRLSFLINAYNAYTVDLILSQYPDIQSIKELGSPFRSPWEKRFFILLGEERSLDDLEHGLIRAPGNFSEPRIHFAVNCASVGCPMLRHEAFTAERLSAQLEDNMRRFLSDSSRNRFDVTSGKMQLSKVFDWYEDDFKQDHQRFTSVKTTLAKYADQLANGSAEVRQRIVRGDYQVIFLEYDWRLNDARD